MLLDVHANMRSPMTSQGHDYAVFQRALRSGSAPLALAAARDLHHVSLDDALRLVLILEGHPLYERAAVRWLQRLAADTPTLGLDHLVDATTALRDATEDDARAEALAVLAATLADLGHDRAAAAALPR